MHTLTEIKELITREKSVLANKHKVKTIGVFGSYVRNKARRGSDLDLLVEFSEPVTLIDFIRTENYLSSITGLNVDLVMKDALKPRIGRRILEEVEPV
jgi:predicted nucleotidyltransferase